jgi:O-antigen/teichoic acid export membrane protein/pimeloyl-ACP methyl ester carboxylesterase
MGMAGVDPVLTVRESPVAFGKDKTIGVVSEPPPSSEAASHPAVLLLNAGLIHRVGPSRTYVRLARALARHGFLTMRFDLPGRGDSDVRRSAESATEQTVDVQAAMDFLEQTKGCKRFILAGICSGAGGAAATARVDDRVEGAILINPLAFSTLQSRVRYYTRRLGSAMSWWNTLTGRNALGRMLRRALRPRRSASAESEMLDAQIESGTVSRHDAVGVLRQLVDRGVRLCVIYSAGPIYNYQRQFEDAFPDVDFRGQLTVEYSAEADHTFTRLVSQQWLETAILSWMRNGSARPTNESPIGLAPDVPDRSGRDRLASNLVWSWAGHTAFVIAGFIVPRLIDRQLGQVYLGVWDFCWSLVAYFSLAQVGIGASVNRHVAMHRAVGNTAALNRTVSSVMVVQLCASGLVLLLTAATVALLPSFFGDRLGAAVDDARWVIGLLGITFAFQMAVHVYRGVLTGCHRWDLHYLIDSASYGLSAIGMTAALLFGGGLRSVAAIVLSGHALGETARVIAAYRVCPELEIRRRYATLGEAWRMLIFGGKLSIGAVAEIILVQTNSVLVLRYLGVGALALYARPQALLRHITILAKKLSLALVPTAGSLQSSGQNDALRELLENGTRHTTLLLTPALLLLAILGDAILQMWMGPGYRQGQVLAVLALGSVLPLTQAPAAYVLIGMNRHGVLAATSVITACVGLAVTRVAIGTLGWGLLGAAASLAVAGTVQGCVVCVVACRALRVPLGRYLWRGYAKPIAAMVPFAAVLFGFRNLSASPMVQACGGAAVGALVLAPLYWHWLIPLGFRQRIVNSIIGIGRHPASASASDRVGD